MRGFGTFPSAARFCSAHDELRGYFRHRTGLHEVLPLGVQREQYRARSAALRAILDGGVAGSVDRIHPVHAGHAAPAPGPYSRT